MGAWGPRSFENDAALDWVMQLERARGTSILERTLGPVADADPDDRVPAEACQVAVAAAEVVSALKGQPAAELPDGVRWWITRARAATHDLIDLAARAVIQVREASELRLEWEQGEPQDWYAEVEDLLRRLEI